jgi:sugar lactone lactonase YvrE
VEEGIVNSNGLGWSPDGRLMYFNDTAAHTTWVYDYDLEDGIARNKRLFIDHGAAGKPDGLCLDTDGNLYCASFSEGVIDVYSPAAAHIGRIGVDAAHVTSCAFGGPDMDTLFITTAADKSGDGRVFQWRGGPRGRAETPFRPGQAFEMKKP